MDSRRTIALGLVVCAVALLATRLSPSTALAIAEQTTSDPLTFGCVVLALYVLRPLLLWPPTLVAVVVGFGFGLSVGVPIALAGAVLTSIVPYYLARWLGNDVGTIARLQSAGERFFDATGDVRGVTAGRLAPVPADAVTCAAAIAGVPFRRFAAGVLVGELPWTIAAVLVGSSLATLSTTGLDGIGVELGIGTALAAGVLLAGPAYQYVRTDSLDVTE
jgi:uncharacterized membrane protein YdjX (TVP38/TMEM64 family)